MADDSGGGGGRPGWIQGGTDFNVDIARLDDFAANVKSEFEDFTGSMDGGIAELMVEGNRFGKGGLAEGTSYGQLESRYRDQLRQLLDDVGMGLNAVTHAAYAVSEEYQGADALSQASIETTRGAFQGIEGRPLLIDPAAGPAGPAGATGPMSPEAAEYQRLSDQNVDPNQAPGGGGGTMGQQGDGVFYEGQAGEHVTPADDLDISGGPVVPTEPGPGVPN